MQKRRDMKVLSRKDKIELEELTNTINKKKREDLCKVNIQNIKLYNSKHQH